MRNSLCLLSRAVLVGLFLIASRLPAEETLESLKNREKQVQQMVTNVMPACVCIRSAGGTGSGSGVVINKEGLILTAAHVTQSAGEKLLIIFPDGKRVAGEALGANRGRDAGMARITEEGEYPFVTVGDYASVSKNQWCVALGHAGGFDPQRTPPIRLGRVINRGGAYVVTDCALIGGDSGGPLFNLDGQVIAIHSNIGASLAWNRHVPIDVFQTDWDRMLNDETWGKLGRRANPRRPVLGVLLQDHPSGGALVADVFKNSPAAKAGIRKEDVITSADGSAIKSRQTLLDLLAKKRLADKVKLTIVRGDERLEVESSLVSAARLFQSQQPPGEEPKKQPSEPNAVPGDKTESAAKPEPPADPAAPTAETNPPKPPSPTAQRPEPESNPDAGKADDGKAEGNESPEKPDATPNRPDKLNIQELLKRARENGGRLKLTPEQMKQVQQQMSKRMRRGRPKPPTTLPNDPWYASLLSAYRPAVGETHQSIAKVLVDDKQVALGTVVSTEGWLLTKSSEIKDKDFSIQFGKKPARQGSLLQRFQEYDLALIQLDEPPENHVDLADHTSLVLGTFVASVATSDIPAGVGVISVGSRSLDSPKKGFLGVALKVHEDGLEVTAVQPRSPAAKSGLKVADIILSFNGETYDNAAAFAAAIGELAPKTKVRLSVRRDDKDLSLEAVLADRSLLTAMSRLGMMDRMSTRMSKNRSGYRLALQHDCPIRPEECGGPLINLDGDVIGINIARAGRIKSYAIPSDVIQEILSDYRSEQEKGCNP